MLGISEENIEYKWIYTELIAETIEKICNENIKFSQLTIDMEEGQIRADADLLITLLRNLIENADKACKDVKNGMVKLIGERIHENVQDGYRIVVTDNGCGMKEEEKEKVTQAFYMIDKARARSTGGSGMGLNICQKICNVSGIEMSIRSKIGQGTQIQLDILDYKESMEEMDEEDVQG